MARRRIKDPDELKERLDVELIENLLDRKLSAHTVSRIHESIIEMFKRGDVVAFVNEDGETILKLTEELL